MIFYEFFVPVQRMESTLEQFTIDFLERDSNVILRMRWDTTAVEVQNWNSKCFN